MNKSFFISPVIAAAGKGTRSGVDYPKCLHEIKNKPILASLLEVLPATSDRVTIIASPSGKKDIEAFLTKHNFHTRIILQKKALGMGNAILQLSTIKQLLCPNILLTWGDLPFINKNTINNLIDFHFSSKNDFSLVTFFTEEAYTRVVRDKKKRILKIIETRETENNESIQPGERDIGLFIFNRDLILDLLAKDLLNSIGSVTGEHGFLYLIEHLVDYGYKVGSIETLNPEEAISFNSPDDIPNFC